MGQQEGNRETAAYHTEMNTISEPGRNSFPGSGVYLKKIISLSGLSLFIYLAVILLSSNLLYVLAQSINQKIPDADWFLWADNATAILLIGFPIYYLIMRRIPNSEKREAVRLKPFKFIMIFFICTAAMYITNIAGGMITAAIAYLKGDKQLINPAAEAIMNSNYAVSLVYASIIAPVIEETIFRKILLDKLRRFGDIPAILMTGMAFGLYHMNLPQFFYAAVLGFIFAYIAIRTNTIKYTIILHMMINFFSTAITPIVTSKNLIGIMLIGLWIFTSVLIGIICFIFTVKDIKFNKADPVLKKSDFIVNPGVILFIILSLAMTVYQTVV
jgi:membrane protease YdiL (CAAX protease family)